MKEQAIAHLRAEMAKKDKHPYVQLIGDYLVRHIEANPSDASCVMTEGKTIEGSLTAMRTVAEKKKVGNVGFLSDAEAYAIVLKYYGIRPDAAAAPAQVPPPELRGGTSPIAPDFSVSLEDFL